MSDESSSSGRSGGGDRRGGKRVPPRPGGRGGPKRGGGRGKPDDRRGGARDDRGADRARGAGGGRNRERDVLAGPANWGRIARRGAGGINEDSGSSRDDPRGDRERPRRSRPADADDALQTDSPRRSVPDRPERNLPDGEDLRRSASRAVQRGRRSPGRDRGPLPPQPVRVVSPEAALRNLVGDQRAKRLARRLDEAGRAFAAEHFDESRKILVPLVKEVPELPEGRELLGLSLYRMGRWKDAITHLEAFRELSGSTEQHPVLADCHRAVGHWADVEALWTELGSVSPSTALVIEGRIVLAGSKADQGDVAGAIAVLEDGWRLPKKPRGHHLRRAYALADLYERAGRNPRARQLFTWIANHDPGLADVKARVRSLS